jgi:hypothetical protein
VKRRVWDWDLEERRQALEQYEVGRVWGVGGLMDMRDWMRPRQ